MTDTSNTGDFRPSQGSITGFDSLILSGGGKNLAEIAWSAKELQDFLLNKNDINFPSNEWLQRIEATMLAHENDFDNPHKTTLSQIVGDFTSQVLGSITPGTVPDVVPFFSFDAQYELPLGTVFPATYTTSNLYRQTSGGWLINPTQESDIIGTDYISNRAGIPLFSSMTNIGAVDWDTAANTRINTGIATLTDSTITYPFVFKELTETPVTGQFGYDLVMQQALQSSYTTSFFVKPSVSMGKLRIYQPSDPSNYMEVSLSDGSYAVYSDVMTGMTVRYVSGVLRISLNYISKNPTPDNKIRIIHINEGASGDGTRLGSLGRKLFSIANPITTRAALNQPAMINLAQPASTSVFTPRMTMAGMPSTIGNLMVTMGISIQPSSVLSSVVDSTILTFGNLLILRTQKEIKVTLGGTLLFTTPILEGYNVITFSYSPTKVIFKDLPNARQEVTGTYPALSTSNISFGPFGGYLHYTAFYAQSDTSKCVEYLNNV